VITKDKKRTPMQGASLALHKCFESRLRTREQACSIAEPSNARKRRIPRNGN
jgi:hypothetical protein